MLKKLILTGMIALFAKSMVAQESGADRKFINRFHSFNTVQLLNGSSRTSAALTTVNGLQFNRFFTGIGVGYDYYFHTSVPLFGELRYNLLERKGRLQLFGNGGVNFVTSLSTNKAENNIGEYKAGATYGGGIDYLVMSKRQAFIIGASFSNKQYYQLVDYYVYNPVENMIENYPRKDHYSLNRIAIRIGWMF